MAYRRTALLALAALVTAGTLLHADRQATSGYPALVALFDEWLSFERPTLRDDVPDYGATAMARTLTDLKGFQSRLAALSPESWTREQQIDHALVRAQLNGHEFYLRTLQPWVRDPAFYKSIWTAQSDTPEHEGPTHHAVVELWTYTFPLSPADEARLTTALRTIPPLLTQARSNLTGNARDLWRTGTGTMQTQVADLESLAQRTTTLGAPLRAAVADATQATRAFVQWLESQAPTKTGPSGIGKEQYTWSLRNVHLVPMSWEEEVVLLTRELNRAHASLKLEEQRNQGRPPLTLVRNEQEFAARANAGVTKFMAFLKDKPVLTVQEYLEPALRRHLGGYVPEATRNFFAIATHYEPVTLYTHFYHWFDHEWLKALPHPSPIRRKAWLYNVWDSRSEGMSTAFEEIVMHAGYYDDNPRAREIVWIMLAQRAARGLASLYAHANEFDIAQAKAFQVQWTPRGWMRPDLDLLGFEQQLYLRQPGYGTSYVTGKALIDELLRTRADQLGDKFTLKGFFDEVNGAGMMPVSLIRWQLTGER
jgi:Bacterial protein of unknown function (DUF885)